MPVANITAARDAIYALLKAAVEASAYSSVPIYYPDAQKANPDAANPYIKAFAEHNVESQVTLGETGNRRYRVFGLLTVQIFTPYGRGQVTADAISGVVKGAYRGVSSGADGIEFRNVQVVDVGREGASLQTNVTAEFEYDEIA